MIRQYVVEWQGFGYYAKAQPTYEWCVTSDLEKAATYKREKGALERACGCNFGSGQPSKTYRLTIVDGNFNVLSVGEWTTKPIPKPKEKQSKDPEISLEMLMGKKS